MGGVDVGSGEARNPAKYILAGGKFRGRFQSRGRSQQSQQHTSYQPTTILRAMADVDDGASAPVSEPLDLAYDSHCNLVLGEVEETIYVVEEDEDEEETIRTIHKKSEMLFVRGDSVVLISPQAPS
ncbi:hypothetical protein NA56DRAFT_713068 [Hyaloscypha hepaticicola]|uniref:Sm domain-containing protein n=1 Tax=Hyaloscypha hepaticicola TaxID=2082293 RepID=A0A2J6PEU3_9HELO|nr:hypothetical protein NA56DRAFT_713068 [Hyaloscypha hepaticicola]